MLIYSLILFINLYFQNIETTENAIVIKIVNEKIEYEILKETDVSISFMASNDSKNKYILYNFDSNIEVNEHREDFYCKSEITAGLVLLLYDNKGRLQIPNTVISPPDSIDYSVMTHERVRQLFDQINHDFRKALIVLPQNQFLEFAKTIDLSEYNLKKGTYYLQLIYYSGDNIINMIDEKVLTSDLRKYQAVLYKGCIKSNKVKLVVE